MLDKSNWCPEELNDPRSEDKKAKQLCIVFAGGNQSSLGKVSQFLQEINLISVQTAECERGFRVMKQILTSPRVSMFIERLEHLHFLYTTDLPLAMFNPRP